MGLFVQFTAVPRHSGSKPSGGKNHSPPPQKKNTGSFLSLLFFAIVTLDWFSPSCTAPTGFTVSPKSGILLVMYYYWERERERERESYFCCFYICISKLISCAQRKRQFPILYLNESTSTFFGCNQKNVFEKAVDCRGVVWLWEEVQGGDLKYCTYVSL